MHELQLQRVFNYQERQVRTVTMDGEPWFVAKDVCDVLEIENSRDTVRRLDEDEKGVGIIDTLGGNQEMAIINEPGLYSLILTSRKPEAKEFKRWITHEVIPAIRKTGSYSKKRNSFPWLDSLSIALRQDTKLRKDLTKPERLRLRAGLLRTAQDETGHDYDFIISILENSAERQEQKIIQVAAVKQARIEREESRTINGQSQRSLDWLREEYASKGKELAYEQEEYLCVRYDLWKTWAVKNKINFTAVLRELHRVGLLKRFKERNQHRYGRKSKRINGKQATFVSLKKVAIGGGPGLLRLIK
jgi:prophage antirepressor-like protein